VDVFRGGVMATFFAAQFSAGMNEIIHPALLDEKSAVLLGNAEIANGKIKSIKMPSLQEQKFPEEFNHFGSSSRSLIKWYERNYWSINNAELPPFYGGDKENYLGIPFPDYIQNVKIEKVSGNLTGNYKYCVTFVNDNGWESAPGSLTDYEKAVEFSSQTAKITVTWSDTKINYAKIYRTQKEGADFFCIGEIKTSGSFLTDDINDYTLAGLEPLSSIDNYPPPERGKYLCESGGVFFLAVGSKLYFSAVGNPHAWPPLNFVGFDDIITGITAEFQGVLVFTANNAYRIIGADSITTVTKTLIPGNQGCSNYRSIAKVANAPIWLSNDGICMWNGESIAIISKQVMNTERLQVNCAVSANDRYYLFLNNRTIVFDHRNGSIFYTLDFTCDYAWYDVESDIMFLQTAGRIYSFGTGEIGEYQYKTPFIGVPEAQYVFFKEAITVIEGTANVTAFVDEEKVWQVKLEHSGKFRLKFPYHTSGKYAQIQIKGIGELKELAVIYG
jgi:hypothetical protein